jgi:hypothetical protein
MGLKRCPNVPVDLRQLALVQATQTCAVEAEPGVLR